MSVNECVFKDVIALKPVFWRNPNRKSAQAALAEISLKYEDIMDAELRLRRFAPLLKRLFPETVDGVIESKLIEAVNMKKTLERVYGKTVKGKLLLKCDNDLKIAGSIKARGGIYETLRHAEDIALRSGKLTLSDDYSIMGDSEFKEMFSGYTIVAGSTGNLGISIGLMSAKLRFKTIIHMSRDAKAWKKELLKKSGVNIVEHEADYGEAVSQGRAQSQGDEKSYFIDDECSRHLFLGYSTAALRLDRQLKSLNVKVDEKHQLHVYIPCGVGGGPGGVMFGLKHLYGDNVHCYFVEPVHSPCMLLGLITRKFNDIHLNDFGIDNITAADGLAVARPSALASSIADKLADGIYTIEDSELFHLLSLLKDDEGIKIEPSSASVLKGPAYASSDTNSTHICWLTGGMLVPEGVYAEIYKRGKFLTSL